MPACIKLSLSLCVWTASPAAASSAMFAHLPLSLPARPPCCCVGRQVTLQSLLWSPRIAERGTRGEVEALIASCQGQLQEAPAVSVADVAAVSAAQLAGVMRKATSGEGGSFDTSVKRVIIGKVCCVLGL